MESKKTFLEVKISLREGQDSGVEVVENSDLKEQIENSFRRENY